RATMVTVRAGGRPRGLVPSIWLNWPRALLRHRGDPEAHGVGDVRAAGIFGNDRRAQVPERFGLDVSQGSEIDLDGSGRVELPGLVDMAAQQHLVGDGQAPRCVQLDGLEADVGADED